MRNVRYDPAGAKKEWTVPLAAASRNDDSVCPGREFNSLATSRSVMPGLTVTVDALAGAVLVVVDDPAGARCDVNAIPLAFCRTAFGCADAGSAVAPWGRAVPFPSRRKGAANSAPPSRAATTSRFRGRTAGAGDLIFDSSSRLGRHPSTYAM